jgi:cysteine desulfuration protein SufE
MDGMRIEEIIENFGVLDEWEDRYRYLIELGRTLEPLSEEEHAPAYKVRGCASQVWLITQIEGSGPDAALTFRGDSDAHIVRGLIAVLFSIYSGRKAAEILDINEKAVFAELGLDSHLTPQRSNGLASMVARVKADATAAAAGSETAPANRPA